jgi:phosphoserine phosphatase
MSAAGARKRIALFDLDHTLLPLDSDHAWGEFTHTIGWTDPVDFKRRNDAFYAHYQAGTLDIHDYVRFATEAARLRGQQACDAAHLQFMREVITPAIRPEALELIRSHDASGWITGEILGVPSMREGKVARVTDWLAARGLDWDAVETTFYSDSTNDLPLLERVDHPVATNPDPRLRAIAAERGWRILDLFKDNT